MEQQNRVAENGKWKPNKYVDDVKRGKFNLAWMDHEAAGTEWGVRARPKSERKGLTLDDINVGSYGLVPDVGGAHHSMAPRGSWIDPGVPDLGYTLNKKSDVWAENLTKLYEEAKTRQWNASTDIPWNELPELPNDLEHAMCQLCTFLSEVEMIAADFPTKYLAQMNQDFHEAKMFLCTQAMDEARHLEVFRKRALANGGGLLRSSRGAEEALKGILEAATFTAGSAFLHLLGEGFILSIFQTGEFIATNDVEKKIFRMTAQDEARHVAYGTMHIKYALANDPDVGGEIHEILDEGEDMIAGALCQAELLEPLAILMAGGVDDIEDGVQGANILWEKIVRDYLHRCDVAGLDRRSRCRLPEESPFA